MFYAIPYVFLIIIVAIVALALFVKFPSLRNYRRKRSIVVYSALLLVFAVLVFQAYDVGCITLVGYRVESETKIHPEAAGQIGLTCSSQGIRSCSFYLILRSVNASFPTQTQLNYIQINETAVKVPFTLSGVFSPTEVTRHLPFEVDENVTGFSFSILPDSWRGCTFVTGQPSVSYVWNITENCFMLRESGIWVV
jgi:hypothetical protein